MYRLRKKTEAIREFIIEKVDAEARDLVSSATTEFGITRQAVHRHIRQLVDRKILARTASGQYQLCPLEEWQKIITIADNPREDVLWRVEVRARIGPLPENVVNIWHYGFTEMFNNVVDHSGSSDALLHIKRTALSTEMMVYDHGIGIFNKIKTEMGLLDERHAVLELTKGKLTTDPDKHTGEGIFFTSRMFDTFGILSSGVFLSHTYGDNEDWILETQEERSGTLISMKLRNDTPRVMKDIFDQYTSGDDYGFTKTVVPVRLARYGDELLVSRSQAKRLLERVDRFKTVLLDFTGVESIGQAFADEVFRVFPHEHPEVSIVEIKATRAVTDMINRARRNTFTAPGTQGELFGNREARKDKPEEGSEDLTS